MTSDLHSRVTRLPLEDKVRLLTGRSETRPAAEAHDRTGNGGHPGNPGFDEGE
jgi:hypothetical protein